MVKKKIVLVTGNFNVLHPGHIRIFRYAKEVGHRLVVGVNGDSLASNQTYISEKLRLEGVKSNIWVDEAFIMKKSIKTLINKIRPDYVLKGKEYQNRENPENKLLQKYGGKLIFSSGESSFSSVDLINKELAGIHSTNIKLPNKYFIRNKINNIQLKKILNNFSKLKICVIGDCIVDEYITCKPLGMSQEDPSIVVSPIDNSKFIGGASIVASHGASLGAQVTFISVAGNDQNHRYILKNLKKYGVQSHIVTDNLRPTNLKQRFRDSRKSLLRVNKIHQEPISFDIENKILSKFRKIVNKIDLLVFSDFNYGCISQSLLEKIMKLCKKKSIKIVADSQSSSQYGDISRFKKMDMITPTEREARVSLKNQEDGLVVLTDKLKTASKAKNVILKLGEEGVLIYTNNKNNKKITTDRIGALNLSPKDVAGAGDSMLIISGMALASKSNIWEAACLGSLASAIQVSRLGNIPIKKEEFDLIL